MGFWDVVNTVGNAIENTAEAVGDTVDDVVEIVTETVEEVVDGASEVAQDIDPTNGFLTAPIVLVAGIVSGAFKAVGDLVHNLAEIGAAVGGIIGAVLRWDLGAALDRLGDLGIHLFDTAVIVLRFVTAGYFIGAIKNQADKASLRRYVKNLITEAFDIDTNQRDEILQKLGLVPFHLFRWVVSAEHRVMRMDSQRLDAGSLPLWQMHENGDLDLYELAGLAPYRWDRQFVRPDTAVVEVTEDGEDAFWPITRERIDQYLDSQGSDVRLRVYAMTRRAASDRMDVARRKLKRMAIYLDWNDPLAFATFQPSTTADIDVEETTDTLYSANGNPFTYRYIHAYQFNFGLSDSFLVDQGLRNGDANENCTVLGCAAFKFYDSRFYGMMLPFGITGIRLWTVYHRDRWPQYAFRYVLGHEIGHYFGLNHENGIDNMMYSPMGSNWFPSNILHYWLNREPGFTLGQGKAAWDFIVSDMRGCLTD